MKKNILLFLSFLLVSCLTFAQNTEKKVELTTDGKANFKWKVTSIDFGDIIQSIPKTAEFELTNTGVAPIIINNAVGSCGCTNVDFPKEPLKPGQTAKIKATYNAAAMGSFHKTITVYMSATPEPQVLEIKGTVKEAKGNVK